MKPLTEEWVVKAENDFRSAEQLSAQPGQTNHDLLCFLAQQSAEKYLKARLQESDIPFPKTHDLALLARLLSPPDPELAELTPKLEALSRLAVEVRYPGYFATGERARVSMELAAEIRAAARRALIQDAP